MSGVRRKRHTGKVDDRLWGSSRIVQPVHQAGPISDVECVWAWCGHDLMAVAAKLSLEPLADEADRAGDEDPHAGQERLVGVTTSRTGIE